MISQEELCQRIAHMLATAPIHDHLGYEALAHLKLPGPDYLALLRALHASLRPKLYVEIGVRRGDSLKLADPSTRVVGIDPNMNFLAVEKERTKNMLLARATSDEFFGVAVNRAKCRGFDLALIDGDHSFEQALRDFENLEALAKPSSVICLHDVIPMDERTAQPKADGVSFHTGDVWRLMASIVANRKDLVAFTVATPPTGLGIVGRFAQQTDGSRGPIQFSPRSIPKGTWPFTDSWDEQARMLNIIPNHPTHIMAALQGHS